MLTVNQLVKDEADALRGTHTQRAEGASLLLKDTSA